MSYDHTEYSRNWARKKREALHRERLIQEGKCPVCEMLMKSKYHVKCPYLGDVDREIKPQPLEDEYDY